jgi:disulfide bond formation protein DsbB
MTIDRHSSNFLLHAIALACIAAVALALVSQYVFDMQPCAWCVLQRLIFLVIALVCWLGIWGRRLCRHAPRISAIVAALLAAGGVTAAWYQYTVASNMFSCDMTFADRFISSLGLDAAVPAVFGIFATCMDARVKLLGVEYALWGLGLFAAIAVVALVTALRRTR